MVQKRLKSIDSNEYSLFLFTGFFFRAGITIYFLFWPDLKGPITPLETWSDRHFEYVVSASDLIPDHVPNSLRIFDLGCRSVFVHSLCTYNYFVFWNQYKNFVNACHRNQTIVNFPTWSCVLCIVTRFRLRNTQLRPQINGIDVKLRFCSVSRNYLDTYF